VDLVGLFAQFDTSNPPPGMAGIGYDLLLRRLSDIILAGAGAPSDSDVVQQAAVPEPASLILMWLAGVGVMTSMRPRVQTISMASP
jgi:hypothetical protein